MRITTANDFGKLISDTRRKANLTQAQLAAASGTGQRFVRELEKGKPSCQLEKALFVAQMLGIKFDAQPPQLTNE
jgi:HTH-type transcriptional regulator / antitoxin HipB